MAGRGKGAGELHAGRNPSREVTPHPPSGRRSQRERSSPIQALGFHSLPFVSLPVTQSTTKFFEGPLKSPGPTEKPNPPRRDPKSKRAQRARLGSSASHDPLRPAGRPRSARRRPAPSPGQQPQRPPPKGRRRPESASLRRLSARRFPGVSLPAAGREEREGADGSERRTR